MRVLLSLFAMSLSAQTPTIDQSLNLKSAGGARISPDGRFVAYSVSGTDWDANAFVSEIWVLMTATGERYQLTHSKKGSFNPEWSPDSKLVAFTSDRDGKSQLYVISPTGGEAKQITKFEGGVSSPRWSPDGKQIAFLSSGPEPKAKKDRKEKLGEFEIVGGDYANQQLWLVKATEDNAKPEAITDGASFSVSQFSWSPDSSRIAFSAAKDPDLSHSDTADLYVVRLSDKYVKKLVDTKGPDGNPIWSPDSGSIAFITAAGKEFFYYQNSHIAIVSADGGTPPKVLTPKFDENPGLSHWGPNGIYFSALQRTSSHIFRLNPDTGAITRITNPDNIMAFGASFTADFSRMAFSCSLPNRYSEICTSPVESFSATTVTNMGDQVKAFKLASRELIEWRSKDGTQIEGILIKPADFNAQKKYPLLVVIHGGPTGIDMPGVNADRTYPIEMFAAKGAVILRPNYRGSAGYGEKFRSLNVRNLGLGDHDDVVSGVDALIAKGFIDPSRVGAMGWSQGGYISAFLTTFSDRFKAVSVGAGISNWMTYYVNTDIHPFTRQYLKATPWEDPEIYRKTSPMSYINRAKTPTLIQHGEFDKRVPIPNAYELYQGLQDRGVPSKLVVYKGFGHGITKPKEQRAVMEHNYEWFSRWIWGEDAPKPAAPASGSPEK
jgi:dipeptidyl aminopeptidase/acylaminoacyl peptidase